MRAHLQIFCAAFIFCISGYAQSVGAITTVAGTGTGGFSGDGGLSISAKIYQAFGVGSIRRAISTSPIPATTGFEK